jgi:hypothetical protein
MDETRYRESRLCRLLGNPVIYQLVVLLENGAPFTPSNLAKLAGRSVQKHGRAKGVKSFVDSWGCNLLSVLRSDFLSDPRVK